MNSIGMHSIHEIAGWLSQFEKNGLGISIKLQYKAAQSIESMRNTI